MLPLMAMLMAIGIGRMPAREPDRANVRAIEAHARELSLTRDSLATHARAVLAISEFFLEWQRLWRASAALRASMPGGGESKELRQAYLHCHPDAPSGTRVATAGGTNYQYARKFEQFSLLQGGQTMFAACPTWILSRMVPDAENERESRDGALISDLRPLARSARDRLLLVLMRAASELRGSGFLTGQLVRFQLDQGEIVSARQSAQRCRAERWWCQALAGYVLDREGNLVEAESTYLAMQASQTPAQRCAWEDARPLLAPSETSGYDKIRCEDRLTSLATMWWLSDPLYRVRGNERWVAHQSRRVDVALHSVLDSDERYAWDVARGGDALARLIMRYDWPTYSWWGGANTDEQHTSYLLGNRSPPAAPYTTFEYTMDRVHLLPSWSVVASPFSATASDWSLALENEQGDIDPAWWSTEHFRLDGRLLQLPEGQTVLLRRESQIAVATAHQLRQPLTSTYSLRFDVMLLSTTSADDVDTLQQKNARGGETVVMRSLIPGTPALLAVEALGSGSPIVQERTRFGVQPPPVLSAMKPGEVAISDPALLSAESGAGDQRMPDEALVDHLLGSLSLGRAQRRFGVYWETYGIAARDTVTISVTMTGDASISGIRRLGMALNMAADPNRSISIRWTEPSPQHYTRTLAGPVPVQMRSLMLNVEQLAAGPYIVRISVERRGVPVVSSQRRVVLQP